MRALVGQITGLDDSRVHLYKMDSIEKDDTPCASVYLSRTTNRVDTMGMDCNSVEREISIYVDFHLDKKISDADNDADAIMDGWLSELELLVWAKDNQQDFADGDIRSVELSEAEFRPADRSRERRGDLVTEWVAVYDEDLS